MKVLVVGAGGREHALAWALRRSSVVRALFVAPGNGGTGSLAQNVRIAPQDIRGLLDFAKRNSVDLTVVGPEAPLVDGIVDAFRSAGRLCFGPSGAASRLEGSKAFAKRFMEKHDIPTADFVVFDDPEAARKHVRAVGPPLVIKADGLAQGKGAVVVDDVEAADEALDEIMVRRAFGESGNRVVVESFLEGEEVSVHAVCAGDRALLLPPSQDHKRIFDGDEGPNTGGMGAYAPVPLVNEDVLEEITRRIVRPALLGMLEEGSIFTGVLYAGLMLTREGPKVLEFNVRFGDPETQSLVPLLRGDLFALLYGASEYRLPEGVELFENRSAATVVVASEGYPGAYKKGVPLRGLDGIEDESRVVFHAGTEATAQGCVTSGGRVLAITAWADDLAGALRHAYDGVARVNFEGAYWRRDIGVRALKHRRPDSKRG